MVLCPVWAVLGSKLNARLSQAVTHRIRIQQHIRKNSWTLGTRHCGQRCGEPTSGQRRVPPADGTYPPLWSRIPCHASLFESRDRELCRECRTLVLRKPKQKGFTSPRLYGYITVYRCVLFGRLEKWYIVQVANRELLLSPNVANTRTDTHVTKTAVMRRYQPAHTENR